MYIKRHLFLFLVQVGQALECLRDYFSHHRLGDSRARVGRRLFNHVVERARFFFKSSAYIVLRGGREDWCGYECETNRDSRLIRIWTRPNPGQLPNKGSCKL
ncbi:hypothetical protein T492DRAFT_542030 [Pavlovales sp. CCMP2436]|nr:hypothetical protein T492DRAFT_542030 [Pavlovales sp. CCMP2436]